MWGAWDLPQYNTCLALSFLSILNLLSLGLLAGVPAPAHFKALILIIYGASLFVHFLYFVRSGRYLGLEHEFRTRPLLAPRSGLALVWLYVAGSFALFFGLLSAGVPRAAA